MPRLLEMRHCHESNEMACMKAVCRRIETNIKGNTLRRQKLSQFFFVCALRDKTALYQRIKYICQQTLSFVIYLSHTCGHVDMLVK